jgi:hypothetical protein
MWTRLLLLGCSLEVAVEGSSHLRMKTPGNTSYCCCCCCSFWCEESKYLYLLLLLLLIMWRILVLSGLVATLLLLLRLALSSRGPPRMHNDAVAVKAQKARWNSWSKLRTTQRPLPPTPHTLLRPTAFKNWALFFPHVLKGEFPPFRALLGVLFQGLKKTQNLGDSFSLKDLSRWSQLEIHMCWITASEWAVPQVRAHPMWSVLGYEGMPYSEGIYQA